MEKKTVPIKTASAARPAAARPAGARPAARTVPAKSGTAARPISAKPGVKKTPARPMTQAQKRKLAKQKQQRKLMLLGAAAIVVIVLLLILLIPGGGEDNTVPAASATIGTPEPIATPTPGVTAEPWTELLPVITRGDPGIKQIAITIDDLNEVENLEGILTLCSQYGAKVTLFPIGEVVNRKPDLQAALKRAYDLGFEIENHSYDHVNLYSLTDEEMAMEVSKQNFAVNKALGLDYEMHFYRMKGGNGEYDLRSHMYLIQNGYKGVVDWSYSGTDASVSSIKKNVDNGYILLFHAKNDDYKKLKTLIPYFASEGYKMVTLNEMFGYEPNAVKALTGDPMSYPIPEPSEFTYNELNYMPIGNRHYTQMYAVQLLQNRLIELNYLDPSVTVDGDYGFISKQAVMLFQQLNGLTADGLPGAQTQSKLFSSSAVPNPGVAFTPTPAPTAAPAN